MSYLINQQTAQAVRDREGDGAVQDMPPPPHTGQQGGPAGPRVISVKKVNVVIKGTKPDPKNFKIRKEKEWNRPHMETYTVSSDNESDQSERPTRSFSRASMYSDTSETSVRLERGKEAAQRQPGNTGYGRPRRQKRRHWTVRGR